MNSVNTFFANMGTLWLLYMKSKVSTMQAAHMISSSTFFKLLLKRHQNSREIDFFWFFF